MGRRGPAPKPTALRVLHGDKKVRINTQEPLPREGVPRPPRWLRPAARVHWRAILRELEPMRVVTMADRDMLALYADAIEDIVVAQAYLDKHGEFLSDPIVDKDGEIVGIRNAVRNPAHMVKNHAFARAYRLGAQFGLTPASRVSLVSGPREDPSGVEALLS